MQLLRLGPRNSNPAWGQGRLHAQSRTVALPARGFLLDQNRLVRAVTAMLTPMLRRWDRRPLVAPTSTSRTLGPSLVASGRPTASVPRWCILPCCSIPMARRRR